MLMYVWMLVDSLLVFVHMFHNLLECEFQVGVVTETFHRAPEDLPVYRGVC